MRRRAIMLLLVTLGALLQVSCGDEASTSTAVGPFSFETPRKSAHYESNTPAHEAVLAAVPINVVIDFNFDLAPPSEIKVMMDGKDYGANETMIDDGALSMRREMDPNAPDGLYTVEYNACWPDGSCHDGQFQFAIDGSLAGSFTDMTGQSIVNVQMKDTSFQPRKIVIDAGTAVVWTNMDAGVEHFVNTDSHPAHTYFPAQNSRGLSQGSSFSVTFNKPGIYLYHCSAHADQMKGEILVR